MSGRALGDVGAEALAALLGGLDEGCIGVAADGEVRFVSAGARELSGEGAERSDARVGRRIAEVVDPPPRPGAGWERATLRTSGGADVEVEAIDIAPDPPLAIVDRIVAVRAPRDDAEVHLELVRRIEHEERLTRLATTFVHVPEGGFDEGVGAALIELGTLPWVRRASVWRLNPSADALVCTHSWSAERPGGGVGLPRPIRLIGSTMIDRMRAGQVVKLDSSSPLGEEWTVEARLLERTGIVAVIGAPMMVDGAFWGFLGVTTRDPEHRFDSWHTRAVSSAAGILAEAFAREEAAQELVRRARRDPLTGLANRWAAIDALADALERVEDSGGVGVHLFDLDRFEAINDALGHAAGDGLLRSVAERLMTAATSRVLVGRLGGDELLVVSEGARDPDATLGLARELQMALAAPFPVDSHEVFVTASVGSAHIARSDLPVGPEEVLGRIDAAMYRAKARGRNRVEVFDARLLADADERLRLERELRTALDRGQLDVHYQPELDLDSGAVRSVEAFVRWDHPRHGLLSADRFIGVAEESDLVVDVGRWVVDAVCAQLRRWQADPSAPPQVRINLSARELANPDLVAALEASLEGAGVGVDRCCVEVSETALMADPALSSSVLRAFDVVGVSTAVDGFGMGHTSLVHLAALPVSTIGIDRSFAAGLVADDGGEGPSVPVVSAMAALGRALGRRVRIAGIESEAQLEVVRSLDVDTAQGYLLGPPVPGADLSV